MFLIKFVFYIQKLLLPKMEAHFLSSEYKNALTVSVTDGEIDVKQNGNPFLNHKSSFIKKNDFKFLVIGTAKGTGGMWTIKGVKS